MAGDIPHGTIADDRGLSLPGIDTTVAHPARVYNFLLGGKDNFAADRKAAEHFLRRAARR